LPLSWLVFGIYFSRKIRSKIISAGVGLLASLALLMVFHIPLTIYKRIKAETAAKEAGFFNAEEQRKALQAGFSTREEQISHVARQEQEREQEALLRHAEQRVKQHFAKHGEQTANTPPKRQDLRKFQTVPRAEERKLSKPDFALMGNAGNWTKSWSTEKAAAAQRCAKTFDQYQLQAVCMKNEKKGYDQMQGDFGLPPSIAEKAKFRCSRTFDKFQLQAVCMKNEKKGYDQMQNY
jgi:hypothetical protein